jgi:hypothetical protein
LLVQVLSQFLAERGNAIQGMVATAQHSKACD